MLERGGKRLTRLAAVFTRLFPNHPHDIPGAHEMNIGKLGSGGAVTSDTCNAALKTSRLLEEAIVTAAKEMGNEEPAVLQIRCWNHLRNVWVGGMTKKLSARLNDELHDELKAIDFRLRVSTSFESVLRALDKEFSLCANYPKGHGEEFAPWMELRHPGALLLAVTRSTGSRQDLVTNGAGCLYFNRQYYVEFLDERLRIPGAANILQVRRTRPCLSPPSPPPPPPPPPSLPALLAIRALTPCLALAAGEPLHCLDVYGDDCTVTRPLDRRPRHRDPRALARCLHPPPRPVRLVGALDGARG